MTATQTLTITLPTETATLVQEAVASGAFSDAGEAVAAALHLWRSEQDNGLLGYTMDQLRALGDEGEASGPGRMTLAEIQREGLRRAAASKAEA